MPISKEEFMKVKIDRLESEIHNAVVFLRQHPDHAFTVEELIDHGVLHHDKLLDFYGYAILADVIDSRTIFGETYFIIRK
jgi:hypothetical protein